MNMAVNDDLALSEVASNLGLNYKTWYNWIKVSMPDSIYTIAGKSKIKKLEYEPHALCLASLVIWLDRDRSCYYEPRVLRNSSKMTIRQLKMFYLLILDSTEWQAYSVAFLC